MTKSEVENLTSELEKFSAEAQKTFGYLSAEQVNWKPSAEAWSVGQCFEHLIKTNRMFFDALDKIVAGHQRNSFWENYSPFSSFFGRLIISELKKDTRKIKAPTPEIIPPTTVSAAIIKDFAAHQMETVEKIKQAENVDLQKTKLTSPLMKLITYKLADGFQIIVEHQKRHFRQAQKVMQNENFPVK